MRDTGRWMNYLKAPKNNEESQGGERAVSQVQKKPSVKEYMPRKKRGDLKGAQLMYLVAYNLMFFNSVLGKRQ